LLLLTEIIAPYRIPVLNALAVRPEIELLVVFLSETDRSLRQWNIYRHEIQFAYEVVPCFRRRIGKFNFLLNARLSGVLNDFQPQALVCGGYSYLASWGAALWARRHDVPLLLWCESTKHDVRAGHRAVEFLKSRFLRQCSAFVVAGRSSSEYLQSLGVAPSRVFTAPNAVDVDFFCTAATRARADAGLRGRLGLPDRYFLFVGRLVTEKGIFELVEAYARLDAGVRRNVGLVIAGDGAQCRQMLKRAKEVVPGCVRWLGFQQREQLAELYGLAEALVFPTHSDPWGLVVNEAMACGLPIFTTEIAGCAPDLVENGRNGFVVPPRDSAALSAAMSAFLENPALAKQMGERSRKKIEGFTPELWAEGVVRAAMQCVAVTAA
jgi:glycosyltransferase involved in cell wall biosynthesis